MLGKYVLFFYFLNLYKLIFVTSMSNAFSIVNFQFNFVNEVSFNFIVLKAICIMFHMYFHHVSHI